MTKIVLVTGASSGIGLASVIAAARAGFSTVATVRDPHRISALRAAADAAEVGIDVVQLDVTDPQSISECVHTVVHRHGRLDALVNNAGVAGANPILEMTDLMSDLRASMEVNFFGVIGMSAAAMPHLRSAGGRLITISSVRGIIGQPFNEGYSAAKFAIEGFMEGLAPVAAAVGVTVSLVEPAAVLDTEFVNSSPSIDVADWPAPAMAYQPAYRAYGAWVRVGAIDGAQTSREVAAVVVRTLTEERPAFRIQTSEYARAYVRRKLADPDGSAIQALTRSWVS